MKKIIVVMDEKQGIARRGRLPWYLPADFEHFKKMTSTGSRIVLMTGKTFRRMRRPLPGRQNVVWSTHMSMTRKITRTVEDLDEFLAANDDVWIIGGTALFNRTLDLTDELYITRIHHDFGCDRFFPSFEDKFMLESKSKQMHQNDLTFHFEKWVRKR